MTTPAAESTAAALKSPTILANMTPARLYEDAIRFDNASITSDGAVAVLSGDKTGRSPKDKRVVRHVESERDVWWSDVNIPLEEASFLAGYSAKVAGTEQGVKEPQATFSACFGAPFLVWHPRKYAELLAAHLEKHRAAAWLINTGWTGGPYGVGKRITLAHTRAILDAIHNGLLLKAETSVEPAFGLSIPKHCDGVPDDLLAPRMAWSDKAAYDAAARKLAKGFRVAAVGL